MLQSQASQQLWAILPPWPPNCMPDKKFRLMIQVFLSSRVSATTAEFHLCVYNGNAGGKHISHLEELWAQGPLDATLVLDVPCWLVSPAGFLPNHWFAFLGVYFFSWISFNCCHFTRSPWSPQGTLSTLNISGIKHTKINSKSMFPHGEMPPFIIEPWCASLEHLRHTSPEQNRTKVKWISFTSSGLGKEGKRRLGRQERQADGEKEDYMVAIFLSDTLVSNCFWGQFAINIESGSRYLVKQWPGQRKHIWEYSESHGDWWGDSSSRQLKAWCSWRFLLTQGCSLYFSSSEIGWN